MAQKPWLTDPLPIVRSLAGKLLLPGDLHEWEGLASDGGLGMQTNRLLLLLWLPWIICYQGL